jgi:hypothetical protein
LAHVFQGDVDCSDALKALGPIRKSDLHLSLLVLVLKKTFSRTLLFVNEEELAFGKVLGTVVIDCATD